MNFQPDFKSALMRQHQSGTLLNDAEALHEHIVSFGVQEINNCAIFTLIFHFQYLKMICILSDFLNWGTL